MMVDVLIVDYNWRAAELIEDMLAQTGYSSVICEDAFRALAMFEQYRPHLMLINSSSINEHSVRYLLNNIRQVDSDTIWVANPRQHESVSEKQCPPTALDA